MSDRDYDPADFAELACPLPTLRYTYDENGDRTVLAVHHCGAVLFVEHEACRYLLAGGECDGAPDRWKVTCEGGHVLLMPDDEGNETLIPFDPKLAQEALLGIGVVAQGDGRISFQPLEPSDAR